MHVICDEEGKTRNVHLEGWDKNNLSQKLISSVESSKNFTEILNRTILGAMFCNTRVLWIKKGDEYMWFWACPSILGKEDCGETVKIIKELGNENDFFTAILLDNGSAKFLLHEDSLSDILHKLKRKGKILNLKIPNELLRQRPNIAEKICFMFNATRNLKAEVRVYGEREIRFLYPQTLALIAMDEKGNIKIIQKDELMKMSEEELKKYVISFPNTKNEELLKEYEDVRKRFPNTFKQEL